MKGPTPPQAALARYQDDSSRNPYVPPRKAEGVHTPDPLDGEPMGQAEIDEALRNIAKLDRVAADILRYRNTCIDAPRVALWSVKMVSSLP